jgi:hypothetical protein
MHLAVGPKHQHGPGRLVPVDLVDATTGQLRLRCTLAEFQTLPPAQEAESVLEPAGLRWLNGVVLPLGCRAALAPGSGVPLARSADEPRRAVPHDRQPVG